MQFPVYGNMISVKNLKNCLELLDDSDYLVVNKFNELSIIKLEHFENGRIKDYKSEKHINFYYEEVRDNEEYLRSDWRNLDEGN